jgi:hypothetical protein
VAVLHMLTCGLCWVCLVSICACPTFFVEISSIGVPRESL